MNSTFMRRHSLLYSCLVLGATVTLATTTKAAWGTTQWGMPQVEVEKRYVGTYEVRKTDSGEIYHRNTTGVIFAGINWGIADFFYGDKGGLEGVKLYVEHGGGDIGKRLLAQFGRPLLQSATVDEMTFVDLTSRDTIEYKLLNSGWCTVEYRHRSLGF